MIPISVQRRTVTFTTLMLWIGALASGCVSYATYPEMEPLSPKPNGMNLRDPVTADSLRPTFQWKPTSPDQKTDLIIWQATKSVDALMAKYDTRGNVVYQKSGITGSQFTLDKDLAPDSAYFWSIRPAGTTDWSTATQHVYGLASGHEPMIFFLFKTLKS